MERKRSKEENHTYSVVMLECLCAGSQNCQLSLGSRTKERLEAGDPMGSGAQNGLSFASRRAVVDFKV